MHGLITPARAVPIDDPTRKITRGHFFISVPGQLARPRRELHRYVSFSARHNFFRALSRERFHGIAQLTSSRNRESCSGKRFGIADYESAVTKPHSYRRVSPLERSDYGSIEEGFPFTPSRTDPGVVTGPTANDDPLYKTVAVVISRRSDARGSTRK